MGQNLTGQTIASTYEDLVQISGSILTNGLGNNIDIIDVVATSASLADTAISASFATTASFALNVPPNNTGSFVITASISNATTTFTKGDGSTFNTTVNNVLNANSASFASTASFALNFNPAATASYALFAISSSRAEFAGDADLLDGNDGTFYRNANNINAGTLSATRLSGNYTINITGSVLGNAATATTATSASFATTATSASFAQNANLAATASFVSGAIATASFAVNAGALDSQNGAFYRNADNINTGTLGSGRLSGTYSIDITGNAGTATSASFATFAANADNLDGSDGTFYRNADNINAGTLNANRLAGTYTIDIAGNAATATTASFATTARSASFASTIANGLNINANTVTASAATFTNLTAVSASFGYVETTTGSAVIIGDAFIILNADSPTLPFAGIKVYDTGSASTASFEWNGNTDNWIVVEEAGASAMILTGLTGSKGSEAAPAVNKLLKGTGNHTVADSSITDNGTNVSFSTPIAGTQISASTGFLGDLIGTASIATNATSASFASTASFVSGVALLGSTNTFTSNNVFSGSVRGEVKALTIASNTASMDLSADNFFTLQLVSGSNTFINPSNIQPGQTINLRVNTTGSATVSFPSSVKQVTGSAYVPTTTTGVDVVTFISFDTSSLLLSNVKNLA
jgi:hypothetical protein